LSTQIKDDVWFRLMYAYPRHLDGEMLDALAADPRFCPYIDMPLQHIADEMLDAMCRKVTKKQTLNLLDLIVKKLPAGAIRTTFIVGYPGENETHFEELLTFVNEGRFTHAGVFLYSTEPLTPAAKLPDSIPFAEKQRRRDAIMLAQREVSRRRQAKRVGQRVEVLVDGAVAAGTEVPRGAHVASRSQLEAPEVDGLIFLKGKSRSVLEPGKVLQVRLTQALDYDMVGEIMHSD
jgi:ribosomal protein S12 methylthiotransferase